MKNHFLLILICLGMFIPSLGQTASTKELEEQIAEIKRVHEAQAKNLATALNQIQEVLAEFQRLNGQVDQNQHMATQQEKSIQDSQRRLEILEDKNQLLLTQLEEIKAAGLMKEAQAKQLGEFRTYQTGLAKINAESYREAIQTFKNFIATNPKSSFVSDAQYWMGEGYFAMRDFPAAVAEFQKVVKNHPKSSKIASSLLKQGFAFFEMQSFQESKAFLSKLTTQYPASSEAARAQARIREIDRLLELKAQQAVEKKEAQ